MSEPKGDEDRTLTYIAAAGVCSLIAGYVVYRFWRSTHDDTVETTSTVTAKEAGKVTGPNLRRNVEQEIQDLMASGEIVSGSSDKVSSSGNNNNNNGAGSMTLPHSASGVGEVPAQPIVLSTESGPLAFSVEDYTASLSRLHMCFCGKSVGGGASLSRCGSCKACYYCSAEHQRHAWSSAPYNHKNFCPEVQHILGTGFSAIANFMSIFSPANAPNIKLHTALEGWSIACTALERKLYHDKYEEGKLVFWAGTCHAMVCGQLMRQNLRVFDLLTLLQYFRPSINFFENAIRVVDGHPRSLEVRPFARFELFGLWSSLALSLKETNVERMVEMFYAAANKYGLPAVDEWLQLLGQDDESGNVDRVAVVQSLHQGIQSVLTILTQRSSSFPLARKLVDRLRTFAETEMGAGFSPAEIAHAPAEMAIFAECLYRSAVEAHEAVAKETTLPESSWGETQLMMLQQKRESLLRQMLQQAFPDLSLDQEK